MPYIGVMYPGFDVYLADTFGVLAEIAPDEDEESGYDRLVGSPVYGARMRQQAQNWFGGRTYAEYPWAGAD